MTVESLVKIENEIKNKYDFNTLRNKIRLIKLEERAEVLSTWKIMEMETLSDCL
jgi:hypothetical protein